MQINLNRLQQKLYKMSKIGATTEGGVTRLALSSEDKLARNLLKEWIARTGMAVRVDDIGNVYGRKEGANPKAKPIVIGSHLDSIINGGIFDGTLGIVSALEVIQTLSDNSIVTKRSIEIVNFTNEEGMRFDSPMLGSGVLSGDYHIKDVYAEVDATGKAFVDELKMIGYLGSSKNRLLEAEAFLELHIEQGPILDRKNVSIGVVESMLGFTWMEVKITGEVNNSGPTPMEMRKDSLCSAAKMILEIQKSAKKIGKRSITTVGKIEAEPGYINAIPGKVTFWVDVRAEDLERQIFGVKLILERIHQIAEEDGVEVQIRSIKSIDPVHFSGHIVHAIEQSAKTLGYPTKRIVSGAGHISTFMNRLCPTAMIFVPSVEGKSHCPDENTKWEDIEKGANVLLYTIEKLAQG